MSILKWFKFNWLKSQERGEILKRLDELENKESVVKYVVGCDPYHVSEKKFNPIVIFTGGDIIAIGDDFYYTAKGDVE